MSIENQMKNCTKCGESFKPLYYEDELCELCDNEDYNIHDSKEIQLKNETNRENQLRNQPYNIWNMIIYPLIFSLLVGLYENGISFLLNSPNIFEVLIEQVLSKGFAYLIMAYYPIKIFVLILNRFTKGKWEWPYSLSYFILPVILFFLMIYLRW